MCVFLLIILIGTGVVCTYRLSNFHNFHNFIWHMLRGSSEIYRTPPVCCFELFSFCFFVCISYYPLPVCFFVSFFEEHNFGTNLKGI